MTGPENTSATASYRLHDRLGFRVSRLAAVMRASLDAELSQLGLTRLEWCVLASIALEGITAPSGIAENIGITRPTASRTFKQMRDKGWLVQNLTEGDGRARAITLTGAGKTCWRGRGCWSTRIRRGFWTSSTPKRRRISYPRWIGCLKGFTTGSTIRRVA